MTIMFCPVQPTIRKSSPCPFVLLIRLALRLSVWGIGETVLTGGETQVHRQQLFSALLPPQRIWRCTGLGSNPFLRGDRTTTNRLLKNKTKVKVDLPPCTRNNVHKYRICCHNNIITKRVHIFNTWFLATNYMCSLIMISDMLSKHVRAVKVF